MLQNLGFRQFAYDWRERNVPTFDAEILALERHHIKLLAWWFPVEADDSLARTTLDVLKHHNAHPQLWVAQSFKYFPKTAKDWNKWLPKDVAMPSTDEEFDRLSDKSKAEVKLAIRRFTELDLTKSPKEQNERLQRETERIYALYTLAAPYGCAIELYSHTGWYADTANLVTLIERLRGLGVTNVGIVYNFVTARDGFHDDTKAFSIVWKKIRPYVVAVNIAGIHDIADAIIYPSQGGIEMEMMRTIQQSGWQGPIGVIAESGGDTSTTLRNNIAGLDWLAAELGQPGSAGPRPFARVP